MAGDAQRQRGLLEVVYSGLARLPWRPRLMVVALLVATSAPPLAALYAALHAPPGAEPPLILRYPVLILLLALGLAIAVVISFEPPREGLRGYGAQLRQRLREIHQAIDGSRAAASPETSATPAKGDPKS